MTTLTEAMDFGVVIFFHKKQIEMASFHSKGSSQFESPLSERAGEGNILHSFTPAFIAERLTQTHNLRPHSKRAYS